MNGALLVAGTHSDAGKSVVVAGLCRWLAREGVTVAPFKAQNMALNSFVTREGAEIGRAQAAQAAAARIEPEAAMNPVLLKPSAERTTQVVVRGKPWATASARSYGPMKRELLPVVLESLEDLRSRFDVVVCEGAGSPAEINLRENDLANMGLARAANLPVLLVGDIDRGGLFASLYGTLALLSPEDQALLAGFLVNKFRGDPAVLEPGLEQMTALTGRPFLGTLPFVRGLGIDGEDSLALDAPRPTKPPLGRDVLRVAVARLGRISNFTDFDALAHEPGISVRFTESPEELLDADLAVLPGTKATVEDLRLLRSAAWTGPSRAGPGAACRRSASAAATRCSGREFWTAWRAGRRRPLASASCPSRPSSREIKSWPGRRGWRRASGTRPSGGTRSTTAGPASTTATRSSSRKPEPKAATSARPSAPPGTASWSPTPSAAPSSRGSPPGAASTGDRAKSPLAQPVRGN